VSKVEVAALKQEKAISAEDAPKSKRHGKRRGGGQIPYFEGGQGKGLETASIYPSHNARYWESVCALTKEARNVKKKWFTKGLDQPLYGKQSQENSCRGLSQKKEDADRPLNLLPHLIKKETGLAGKS